MSVSVPVYIKVKTHHCFWTHVHTHALSLCIKKAYIFKKKILPHK